MKEFIEKLLYFKKSVNSNIYDVEFRYTEELKTYSSIELHFILYPYSRKINSTNIRFLPFEEYINDVSSSQHSAYQKMNKRFHEVFGLLLGSLIAGIFYYYKPEILFSVESIVGVFAAYSIGKELWDDILRLAINLTKESKLRFTEDYYKYELDENTTMTHYSKLAKKKRYAKDTILPKKLHFLELSNSQTLRMYFEKNDFEQLSDTQIHLFSVHIDSNLIKEFEKKGYLFGVKVSLNKKTIGITKSLEFFQSIHGKEKGCLDADQIWHKNKIFYRKSLSINRLKYFLERGLLEEKIIFK
jgi:hypothetical protein